jgi:pimeloyl-ACP methyl ester carboxylesterase
MAAPALLVIHDAGDPQAGSRWTELLEAWPGPAVAPDLPGHGSSPPPTGASYAPGDAAFAADQALQAAGLTDGDVVVLGHGWGGFAAEFLAAAGRATRLVLVDGLGPPWCTVEELVADQQRWLRGALADPAALAPPGDRRPDPRLQRGFWSIWEQGFIAGLRAAISVPVLAIESPDSPTPGAERDERLAAFPGPAERMDVAGDLPGAVVGAMRHAGWL